MARRVPGGVNHAEARPDLAIVRIEVKHVELGKPLHRGPRRVAAHHAEGFPVGGWAAWTAFGNRGSPATTAPPAWSACRWVWITVVTSAGSTAAAANASSIGV